MAVVTVRAVQHGYPRLEQHPRIPGVYLALCDCGYREQFAYTMDARKAVTDHTIEVERHHAATGTLVVMDAWLS